VGLIKEEKEKREEVRFNPLTRFTVRIRGTPLPMGERH